MSDPASNDPVLLYDGVCGFCNGTVRFIIARDKTGTMRFAPLQSDYGRDAVKRHPSLEGVDSLVLIKPLADRKERVFVKSDAALQIAAYLGGVWKLSLALYIVPAPLRDFIYDLFAKYRYRLFGRHESCPLPPPGVRSRFLDAG